MDRPQSGMIERVSRRLALRGLGAAGVGAALGWSARPAAAQDSTPAAGGCFDDPGVGDTVTVVGPDGAPLITLTATEVIDPFEQYDPSASPPRGMRFVVIRIDAEGVGPRPFDLNPSAFYVQDRDGFLIRASNIRLAADVTLAPLDRQSLENGSIAKGFLGFSVLTGVELHRLLFIPSSDRLVLVADLRG